MEKINEEYFKIMIEKLKLEDITLEQFKEYIVNFENAFRKNDINIKINYIDLLLSANIKCASESEFLEWGKLKRHLRQLKFEVFCKIYFENIDLKNYYEMIKTILKSQFISFDEFYDYFRLFSLFVDNDISNVNLNEFGTLLLNAKVKVNNSIENNKLSFTRFNIKLMLTFCMGTTKKIRPRIK